MQAKFYYSPMTLRPIAQYLWVLLLIAAPILRTSAGSLPDQLIEKQTLGRTLFFDAGLSRNGDVSCASCHQPKHAFADAKRVAVGTAHQRGARNTPSLLALDSGPFFWDGRAEQLEQVMPQPFINPVEMGLASQDELVGRIQASQDYVQAFTAAFPNSRQAITIENVEHALATYVRSIGGGTSAYDRYSAGLDQNALSPPARHGLSLFQGVANCSECHRVESTRASFTDNAFHSTLIDPKLAPALPARAIQLARENPAGAQLGAEIEADPQVSELGRYVVTHDPKDIGSFRTPSLRNVAFTAPYMHDGSVMTLREAVDREIYYRNLQSNRPNSLTERDRRDLVAFLESLSDVQLGANEPHAKDHRGNMK